MIDEVEGKEGRSRSAAPTVLGKFLRRIKSMTTKEITWLPRVPAQAGALLKDLQNTLPLILGRNLVGIYLYGSITNSSFNPKRSDIDCIAVTKHRVSEAQFRKLEVWLAEMTKSNRWTTRLQMSFLPKNQILVSSEPSNLTCCLYQFGVLRRCGSDGNPIIWLDHLRNGKALVGPPAKSFLPEITEEILSEALTLELGYLREELKSAKSEWRDVPMYRAYATLTICRILYTLEKGKVVSKPKAAGWAIENFDERWRGIIEQALHYNLTGQDVQISLVKLRSFLQYAQTRR